MAEDQLFCVGQKAVIEKAGAVLVLNDPIFGSDLPGGKIQEGETDFLESLKREVREETGLEITIGQPISTGYFDCPTDSNHRNAGKKIFIIYFEATYLSGELILSDEHDSYQWVTKESYREFFSGSNKETNVFNALTVYFDL